MSATQVQGPGSESPEPKWEAAQGCADRDRQISEANWPSTLVESINFKFSERHYLKRQWWRVIKDARPLTSGLCPQVPTLVNTHSSASNHTKEYIHHSRPIHKQQNSTSILAYWFPIETFCFPNGLLAVLCASWQVIVEWTRKKKFLVSSLSISGSVHMWQTIITSSLLVLICFLAGPFVLWAQRHFPF